MFPTADGANYAQHRLDMIYQLITFRKLIAFEDSQDV